MSIYYYTPIFEHEVGQTMDEQDPPQPIAGTGCTQYEPGLLDTDGLTILLAEPPPGTTSPLYDKGTRFVLVCPDGSTAESGWTVKTKIEISADYPALVL
jgi:hypothetical protein